MITQNSVVKIQNLIVNHESQPVKFFPGCQGGKSAKNGPKWQKIMSVKLHISGTVHHMIIVYGTHV